MNRYFLLLVSLLGMFFFGNWACESSQPIDQAEWLVGTWAFQSPQGTLYEQWSVSSPTTMNGKSYVLNEADTVVFETIQLIQEPDQLYYVPTVKNQNDGESVRFALTRQTPGELVFENPEHDFPQIISYTQINPDSLVAEISGMVRGQERKQRFPMRKVAEAGK